MRPPANASRWPLAVTIGVTLIVKVIILTLLHKAFFSAPQAKKMRMPTEKVERHFLSNPVLPLPKAKP